MNDPRITTLAETLIDHSCKLKAGEKILIECLDLPEPALVCRLVEQARLRQAIPIVSWKNNEVLRSLYQTGSAESLGFIGELEASRMGQVDVANELLIQTHRGGVWTHPQTSIQFESYRTIRGVTFVLESKFGQQALQNVLRTQYMARRSPAKLDLVPARNRKSKIRIKGSDPPNFVRACRRSRGHFFNGF